MPFSATADDILAELPATVQQGPLDPTAVVDELVRVVEPGLMAIPSGRFFGWVMGGSLPAALASDWLVSAWDQNTGLRFATPAMAAIEEAAGRWLLDLLDLPRSASVAFVTGGQMANLVCLAAARGRVLADAGWDVVADGLIGAPPGYVGYEDSGTLTKAVRRKPYSVILLDEIEKAHPEVFNILLQVLEDGRLTESKGRTVDFRNTVIIMTSNAGAQVIRGDRQLGFTVKEDEAEQHEKMKNRVMDEVKKLFRPEFINRLDEIIIFHSLNKEHLKEIVHLEVKKVGARLKEQGVELTISDKGLEKLVLEGYDPTYGARPLRRAIQRLLEDPLSEEMLGKPFKYGEQVHVDLDEDAKIIFKRTEPTAESVGAATAAEKKNG